MRANKQYFFKDEHVASLFKLFHKSKKLKLPEAKRPGEVGKTDDPTIAYITRWWNILQRAATSSKMLSKL